MTRTLPALAALAVLAAAPALAHGTHAPGSGGPKSPTAAAAAGICSAEQLAILDEAFRDAAPRVRAAMALIEREPNLPEYRRWFGDTPAKFVRRTLGSIAAHLERGRPSEVACNAPGECPEERFAYANMRSGAMGFCPRFFAAPATGFDSRLGVVVHEVSHVAARTRDAAYQPDSVLDLAKQHPGVSAMNADSYEYFIESLNR